MNRATIFIRRLFIISFAVTMFTHCTYRSKEDLIKVLILSGNNNHEWQKTTPLLIRIFKDSRLFTINVTEKPDTLTYKDFIKFDVVVSNWNTWPDNDFRFSNAWENDFLRYVKRGGGVVSFHAGASSFYGWEEYHRIGIGRWGKETSHGNLQKGKISDFDQLHSITKGLRDFYVIDEIWEKTDIHQAARAIASVSATEGNNRNPINEPAVFVSQTGKGRCFFSILGHNERALLNTGLQTLLLRASQWAAHHKVTIKPPQELNAGLTSGGYNYRWEESDTTFGLLNNNSVVWRYNFNNRFGKPYFHPVTVKNSPVTCLSPPDHPWHLGLWFSWKFINGVNYWEYLNDFKSDETGYRSEGITGLQKIEIIKNLDFSATITMELQYHPSGGEPVMNEKRNIYISPPGDDGSYFIDNEYSFTPLVNELVLDRAPVEGEPDGKSWGGYAGLSVRVNQDYTSPIVIAPAEGENYKKNNWLYMGFNTLTGDTAGICILQNMKFTTSSTSWYVINNPEIPFFYYSPAVLFDGKIILKKGEKLELKYRVWLIPGKTGKDILQAKYDEYIRN